MNPAEARIALNMIPQMGPVRLRKLLEVFGEPERVLAAPRDQLASVEGIGRELASSLSRWEDHVDLPAELARMKEADVTVVTEADPTYPKLLRTIHDPPIVLYVWGELTEKDGHGFGVVGSRQVSHYGTECAKKFGYQLAYAGLTVYSGLARGIDTAAHLGALAAKGRTVAVMGGGLSEIYPSENFELAEKIVAGQGALISEFSMSVQPDRQTFPMRNRIISGASYGVLVVEAGSKSGALHSATFAAEQGRSVFAVPGPIDRPGCHGSNRLIQQGAKLTMDAADILDDLPGLFAPADLPPAASPRPSPENLTAEERRVFESIGDRETPIDVIIRQSGLPTGTVSSTLFALELKRAVKQLPGKNFVRLS
jgi:DNA processing protein